FPPPPTTQIYTLSLHDALPIFRINAFPFRHDLKIISLRSLISVITVSCFPPFNNKSPVSHRCLGTGADPLQCLFQPSQYFIHISLILFLDRKSTRLNSSHVKISYAVFCLKKKK